jgi:YcxB-like protein
MPIVGQAMMDAPTYRAAVRVLSRSYFRLVRIVGVAFAAAGVALLAVGASDLAVVGAGCAVAGLLLAAFLPLRMLRLLSRRAAPTWAAPWWYEIDADAIRLATPLARSEWRWPAIGAIEEHPQFWLLRTTMKGQAVVVLKRAFDEADQASLAQLLQEHGLARPTAA